MIQQIYRLQILFQNFVSVIENIKMLDRYQLDLVNKLIYKVPRNLKQLFVNCANDFEF